MSSLSFQQTFTIGAGLSNNNLLIGDLLQLLQEDMDLTFWATQSALGLEARITVGPTVVGGTGTPMRANVDATGNVDTLRDGFGSAFGAKNDQVVVAVTNPTGGPLNFTLKVQAEPVPAAVV